MRQEVEDKLVIHFDLVHTRWADTHRDQYDALINHRKTGEALLSDLVNPIVITAEGQLRPLTYGLDKRFDLGAVSEVNALLIAEYKRTRLDDLRNRVIAALEWAAGQDRLIDWFTFCTEDFQPMTSQPRPRLTSQSSRS